MKIAIWHNLNSGGGKRALYYHVKGLVDRGHEVVSYCPDTVDQQFLPLSEIVEEKIIPLKTHASGKGRFHLKTDIGDNTKALLQHCKACADDINANNFDVLFANSSSLFYISHIARFVKIPKLIYLGEPYRKAYEAMPEFLWKAPSIEGSKLKYIYKRFMHLYNMYWYSYLCREEFISASSYDLILVNSIYSRETVKRSYGLESKVCYLGIDTDHFTPVNEAKENFVLGLGLVHVSKGIERAIDTLSLINENVRPAMIWVGNNKSNGTYINHIKDHAEKKGVRLTIKTYITDNELIGLLRKASTLLYLPNLEPFGLAPLEANACGTAVVALQEGGLKETIKNGVNGYTTINYDPNELAGFIEKFSDLGFAKRMGNAAREYVAENWSYTKGIDNIENYLSTILIKR
jgi:glycosyltransferase involved in cell wall biosynthesis